MADFINTFSDWFLGLGQQYGVNPIIFGSIYVGAIPLFSVSLAWFIRNLKSKKPIIIPAFLTAFFFISAYLYLIIAGKNVPVWVYAFVVIMIISGAISTWLKIRKSLATH